jgi:hypothetical protein
VPKRWSFVIVLLIIILILAAFIIIIGRGSLHSGQVHGGKRGKGVLISRRLEKRELIKVIKAHLLILAMLAAEEYILPLAGVPTPGKHALENPQDAAG